MVKWILERSYSFMEAFFLSLTNLAALHSSIDNFYITDYLTMNWLMQMSDISPIKNLYVAEIFFFFDQKSFSGPYWLWKNHVLYKLETLLGISQKKKKEQSHADALGLDCQIWIIVPYLYMYMFTFLMKLQFYFEIISSFVSDWFMKNLWIST